MKIDVIQKKSEGQNWFDISYNGTKVYNATTPFLVVTDTFNLNKFREIKIFDLNNNIIGNTDYQYFANVKEEIIPFKYLITGSQKFYQLIFNINNQVIKVYYEEREIWDNCFVVEVNNKKYNCYAIEDGYIKHIPIYDNNIQVAEALKSNVVINGQDEYCCYLKNEYEFLKDSIVCLLLYLDFSRYNSSYLKNNSFTYNKKFSYNKTNKFYDKNWVINNFDNKFYEKVESDLNLVKNHKTSLVSSNNTLKNLLFAITGVAILIFIGVVIAIIFLLRRG